MGEMEERRKLQYLLDINKGILLFLEERCDGLWTEVPPVFPYHHPHIEPYVLATGWLENPPNSCAIGYFV